MIQYISSALILLIDLMTYFFTWISIYSEHTIYPYLRDPDMTAWKYVVNVGVLHWSIIVATICTVISFLLGVSYCLILRSVRYRLLSILFTGLVVLSVTRIFILGNNLNMLLNISKSLTPCEQGVRHIQCSPIKYD
jgi:hypothetical protein